jgi:hypothetical protein
MHSPTHTIDIDTEDRCRNCGRTVATAQQGFCGQVDCDDVAFTVPRPKPTQQPEIHDDIYSPVAVHEYCKRRRAEIAAITDIHDLPV